MLVPDIRQSLNLVARCLKRDYAIIIWLRLVEADSFMLTKG